MNVPSTASPPIPTHVVTGTLGAGKTSAIARLFAGKPADERWVVILNEFTDSGIDVLTVAGAARGEFDVRLVPGGCLCCASELDFTRTLRELVRGPRPARLFVEPSGIGHPAAIVEELLGHAARGALAVESIVCLVDPARAATLAGAAAPVDGGAGALDEVARAQAEVADVLLLSKAELADASVVAAFRRWAEGFYPAKRWIGTMRAAELPPEALAPPAPRPRFALLPRPALHAAERERAASPARDAAGGDAVVAVAALGAERRVVRRFGREAAAWTFPRAVGFARPDVLQLLERSPLAASAERIKGVLRTGPEHWTLFQRAAGAVSTAESSWRRDSRVEVLLASGADADWAAWDRAWFEAHARAAS